MGLLSWWRGKGGTAATGGAAAAVSNPEPLARPAGEATAMNGAAEVRRPLDVTVFEFGSAMTSGDRVTLAGYCPVSDELEPCRWEILPTTGSDAPQFRSTNRSIGSAARFDGGNRQIHVVGSIEKHIEPGQLGQRHSSRMRLTQ